MRIIRTMLFLTAVVILMPSPPKSDNAGTQLAALDEPSSVDLFFAATRAASDVGSFCDRQPGVCETAIYVAGVIEAKAKYNAKLIYEWANEASGDPAPSQADGSDDIITGSTRFAGDEAGQSQNTLTAADLIPEWRAPDRGPKVKG